MEQPFKKKRKCPHCNSSRITYNEGNEMHCKKCGYVHSKNKETMLIGFATTGELDSENGKESDKEREESVNQ